MASEAPQRVSAVSGSHCFILWWWFIRYVFFAYSFPILREMISDDGNDKDDNDDEDDEYDSGIFTDQNVQKLHRINQRKGHWLYSGIQCR